MTVIVLLVLSSVLFVLGYFVGVAGSRSGHVGRPIWVVLKAVPDPDDDEGVIVEVCTAHVSKTVAERNELRAQCTGPVWTDIIEIELER